MRYGIALLFIIMFGLGITNLYLADGISDFEREINNSKKILTQKKIDYEKLEIKYANSLNLEKIKKEMQKDGMEVSQEIKTFRIK